MLRTFSKIYGLAGLRVGYGVAPADVVTAIGKVRRAFDVTAPAQVAALASLDATQELARRRASERAGAAQLEHPARRTGSSRSARRSANFVYVGGRRRRAPLFERSCARA